MPGFSVIIPNYNHAAFLAQRIDSVLQQGFVDFETILLDDASIDESRKIIEQYRGHPKVAKIIFNDRNSGSPFKQWKKGIEAANADWIWIAETDDFADSSFLETASKTIQQYPGTSIFFCDANIVDELGVKQLPEKFSIIKNNFFHTHRWDSDYHSAGIEELNANLKFVCSINNASSVIFRKDLLITFLDQLETFTYHGDWFCYIRMALLGDISYTSRPLNTVRSHQQSLSNKKKNIVQSKKEHFRILQFLLKQKNITGKRKLLQFFTEQYLSIGFFSDGFKSFKIIGSYLSMNFMVATNILARIIWIKLIRKKIKPVF